MTEKVDEKLRPIFRIMAICLGAPMLIFGLITPFWVDAWTFSLAIEMVGRIALGALFLHAGSTGTNYYSETNDDTDDQES